MIQVTPVVPLSNMDIDHLQKPYFSVILVVLLFRFGGTVYTLTENTMTYQEANRTCQLATPEINYSYRTLDLGSSMKNASGTFWVGYTYTSAVFQYIGCSLEEGVSGVSIRNYSIGKSPGNCHSACSTDIFGLKDSLCYCFATHPEVKDTEQYCNLICGDYVSICGGVSPAAVSMFSGTLTSVTVDVIEGDDEKGAFNCVALSTETNWYTWENCFSKFSTRCQTKEATPILNDNTRGNWGESASSCISQNRYPLSKTLNQSFNLGDKMPDQPDKLWTGFFRSDEVIRTSRDPGIPVQFGYVEVEEGNRKAILKFVRVSFNYSKTAICEEDMEETTTVTTKTVTSDTTRPPTSTTRPSTVILAAGIPAAIVVFIVVVVGVILCFRKRRSRKTSSTRAPEMAQQYSQVQDSYDDTQNVYQEPFDKVTNSPDNARIPLQEHKGQQSYDDDAYDVTGAANAARADAKPSDNIYNKLKDVDNDTYDHTGDVKKNCSENEYASAVTATSKEGDDNYDVSGVDLHKAPGKTGMVLVENTYDRVNGTEGSYSQVNKTFPSTGPTDNVYN